MMEFPRLLFVTRSPDAGRQYYQVPVWESMRESAARRPVSLEPEQKHRLQWQLTGPSPAHCPEPELCCRNHRGQLWSGEVKASLSSYVQTGITLDSKSFASNSQLLTTSLSTLHTGRGTSLVVQWLRLRVPNAGGVGSIPGQGTKIPHAAWHSARTRARAHTHTHTRICWQAQGKFPALTPYFSQP